MAAIGVSGFALTYGFHIASPVYDAYQGGSGDDDDKAEKDAPAPIAEAED